MQSMHQQLQAHSTDSSLHLQQSQGDSSVFSSQSVDVNCGASQEHQQHHDHHLHQTNMTVLVKLDESQPANQAVNQPVLSVLEPVQQQQQQQQQATNQAIQPAPPPPVIHHLVQQEPQLHMLSAPCAHHEQQQQHEQLDNQQQQQQPLGHEQQQQHRQPSQQIEGIVADGGGPIVQWLLDNYEIADGESLPRSTVYNHYLAHCRQLRMASVNAASFGKLIRSVFVGLKTRRLGTRGHSKYHYFGIRAKQHVRLEWLHESDEQSTHHEDHHQGHHHQHHNHHHQHHHIHGHHQGRSAGCSSSAAAGAGNMMQDPSQENSNTDQGGSESDSTGDCHSGRLSSLGGGSVCNNAIGASTKRMKRLHENDSVDMAAAYGQVVAGEVQGNNQHRFAEQMMLDGAQGGQHDYAHYANGHNGKSAADPWQAFEQCDLTGLRRYLGANHETLVDEHWPQIELDQLVEQARQTQMAGIDNVEELANLIQVFESQYKCHYKRVVELLANLQFCDVEHLWLEFWNPTPHPVAHETIQHWTSVNDTTTATSTIDTNGSGHLHDHHRQPVMPGQHLIYVHHDQHQHAQTQEQQQQMQTNSGQTGNLLSSNQLYQLTSYPAMMERINQIDYKLYSAIEAFLMPDILRPIPRTLIHLIRTFARNISPWMEAAMKDYATMFLGAKLKSVRAFEHALRRYTSINHLAASARAIWSKRSVLTQMSTDLSRIDLRDIEHQVSLMSQAKFDHQQQQNNDFMLPTGTQHATSQQNHTATPDIPQQPIVEHNEPSQDQHQHLNHHQRAHLGDSSQTSSNGNNDPIAKAAPNLLNQSNDNIENNYLQSNGNQLHVHHHQHHHQHLPQQSLVADRLMVQPAQLIQNFLHLLDDPYPANIWPDWCRNLVESRVSGQSFEEARNFILKWNFYVSLLLRELTLRSAPSLGSFQLIRLLFDEYMYYLVVTRLAQVQHKTSIQMLTTSIRFENIH